MSTNHNPKSVSSPTTYRLPPTNRGFTLVEMLIIAPMVILLIGGFISAIVSMTGAVIASRASSGLAINIQDALNRIDLDVKSSNSLLATNSITPLTSPQGYNDDTTDFKNVGTNGTMLIISSNATTGNPSNSTSNTVYWNNQPNPCSSSVNTNTPVAINIVYFVKNNSLWRRTIMPSGYSTASCVNGALGQPWQRSSCAVSTGVDPCKTQDEKLLSWTKSGSFAVDYFTNTDTVTPIPGAVTGNDAVRLAAIQTASSVKVTITATSTVAGRDVTQSGYMRVAKMNNIIAGLPLSNSGGGSWLYKRPITITNSSGSALTNYQIKLSLTTAALGNPYTHIKTDGSDVRFMDSNGTTEYSYWNEAWNNTSTSTIWVKIPSLATGDTTINMYYGNPSAIATSSDSSTFPSNYLASTGFSGTQGVNNWYYQEYNGSTYSNMTYNSGSSSWSGTDVNSLVWNNGMHPHPTAAYDSARKWLSNGSYSLIVYGNVSKSNVGCGNGVITRIYKNATQLYTQTMAFNDAVGYNYLLYTNVINNDAIYFRLNNNSEYSCDGTNFNPKILVRQYVATEPTHTPPGTETAP